MKLLEKSEKITSRKLLNNQFKFACFCFVTDYGQPKLVSTYIIHIIYGDISQQFFLIPKHYIHTYIHTYIHSYIHYKIIKSCTIIKSNDTQENED